MSTIADAILAMDLLAPPGTHWIGGCAGPSRFTLQPASLLLPESAGVEATQLMYIDRTAQVDSVHVTDAATVGCVLVVDDDAAFGRFMIAALESRGHEADWAGTAADALGSLYNREYDLVLIDSNLSDASGLDLLREATDYRLLENSSAVILAGHDFEEPDDIRVIRKPVDVDSFLERIGEIIAQTRRRNGGTAAARRLSGAPSRGGNSRVRPRSASRIELMLYTSAASEKSRKAIRAVERVLEQYDRSQVQFTICDLSERPAAGERDAVVFTPTLVKVAPSPRTWIIGNLDQPDLLADLLEVSGVDRRR